jgi:hypothetical protein
MRQYSNLIHGWPYHREINAGYRIRIEPARAGAADPAHWISAAAALSPGRINGQSPGSGVLVSNRGFAASRLWQ